MTSSKILHIDIETYSSNDIKLGVYEYADADDFETMLIGYAYDDGPVMQVSLADGEKFPATLRADILDPKVIKVAHNATFERTCLARTLLGKGKRIDADGWRCTMAIASMLGLPKSLKNVGIALGLKEDDRKMDSIGTRLISFFAVPQTPKRTNNFRKRNLPHDDPEKWELYKRYNHNDVVAEREIYRIETGLLRIPKEEWEAYRLDALINDIGVSIDGKLCESIDSYIHGHLGELSERLKRITGLENPNSVKQMSEWLRSRGIEVRSLGKESLDEIMSATDDGDVIEALAIMQQTKKTSTSKYRTMLDSAVLHEDGLLKCHGTLQYYGASRTGRWAGRIIQTQNLPRNTIRFLPEVRELAREGDFESIALAYPNTMQVMSELIRTALVPEKGERFVVADYNAIESRVAAWLADERWKLEAFEQGKGIYEATASKMFGIPIESISHDSPERAKGKVAELAGQYQGGVGAYKRFGAEKFGWSDSQIQGLVDSWRAANSSIVDYWRRLEKAVSGAIERAGTVNGMGHGVSVSMRGKALFIRLPSGRELAYQNIRIEEASGKRTICYDGESVGAKWGRIESYGGKFFENVVQATARDCLRDAMAALAKKGFIPRFHVHDEVIVSVPYDEWPDNAAIINEITRTMAESAGNYDTKIPLKVAGYSCRFYLKD